MLNVTYTYLCDACGAEVGTENFSSQRGAVMRMPTQPMHFGLHPGGWFADLCEGCFEPLREPLREIGRAGLAKKEAAK